MNLLDLMTGDGISLRRVGATHGGEYAAPCPWCGGRDRFRVWPNEGDKGGRFWCRQCSRAGDAIDFLRERRGLNYRAACALLGVSPGRAPAAWSRPPSRVVRGPAAPLPIKPRPDPAALWQQQAARFVADCERTLSGPAGAAMRAFLTDRRGLTAETIRRFRLGIHLADDHRDRAAWGLNADPESKPLWLPAGLVVPLAAANGAVLRLRIRTDRTELRYYTAPGSSFAPYIVGDDPRRPVLLLESDLDALLMAQLAGDLVNVAALGAAQTAPDETLNALVDAAPLMYCALDADDAGDAAAEKWREAWPAKFRRLRPPKGKDPGEAWQSGVDLRAWIVAALPPKYRPCLEAPAPRPAAPICAPVGDASAVTSTEPVTSGDNDEVPCWIPCQQYGEDLTVEKAQALFGALWRQADPARLARLRRFVGGRGGGDNAASHFTDEDDRRAFAKRKRELVQNEHLRPCDAASEAFVLAALASKKSTATTPGDNDGH